MSTSLMISSKAFCCKKPFNQDFLKQAFLILTFLKVVFKVIIEIRHHLASGQECLHDEVSDFLKNGAEIRCCLCLGHLISGLLIFL